MPLRDYRCDGCGDGFEVLEGAGEPPFERCPECGSSDVRRLVGIPAARVYTQFMDPAETALHRRNQLDIEKQARAGKLLDLKEKGPSEFRPRLEKRFH